MEILNAIRFCTILAATTMLSACGSPGPYKPDDSPSEYIRNELGNNSVIVFVHGVMGGATTTWQNPVTNKTWGKLIAEDPQFSDLNIFTYGYDSPLLAKALSIDDIALNMRNTLLTKGVLRHKRIIFVVHSMGGLVTRAFLLHEPQVREQQVSYIHYFGTPGSGSIYGNAAADVLHSMNPQYSNMVEMKSGDYLSKTLREWRKSGATKTQAFCSCETQPIAFGLPLVVSEGSCALMCETPTRPLNADHINIVKPADFKSDPYVDFVAAYRDSNTTEVQQSFETKALRLLGEIKGLLSNQLVLSKKTPQVQVRQFAIDPTRHVYLQLRFFPGDQVEVIDPAEHIKSVSYIIAPGQLVQAGKKFTVQGVPGVAVVPTFEFMSDVHDTKPIDIKVTSTTDLDEQRQLDDLTKSDATAAPAPPKPTPEESSLIPGAWPTKSQIDNLCLQLKMATAHLQCEASPDNVLHIEPTIYFGSGQWSNPGIRQLIHLLAKSVKELGIRGTATVYASSSSSSFACASLRPWPNNEWMTYDRSTGKFTLRSKQSYQTGKVAVDSRVICGLQDDSDSREPNSLLSHARASWVADVLSKQSDGQVHSIELKPLGKSNAIGGNAARDRRVAISITAQ